MSGCCWQAEIMRGINHTVLCSYEKLQVDGISPYLNIYFNLSKCTFHAPPHYTVIVQGMHADLRCSRYTDLNGYCGILTLLLFVVSISVLQQNCS